LLSDWSFSDLDGFGFSKVRIQDFRIFQDLVSVSFGVGLSVFQDLAFSLFKFRGLIRLVFRLDLVLSVFQDLAFCLSF